MSSNLRKTAPSLSTYFPEPSCSGQSQIRIDGAYSIPPNSDEQPTQTSERHHRVIINRAAIQIESAFLQMKSPEMAEIILNDYQDDKGKRKKALILSDLTILPSDSITLQLKKEYLKRKLTPEPLFFHPNQVIQEINIKLGDPGKACFVKANVKNYTPAILKAMEIQQINICQEAFQNISQGIEEKHMKMAYGNLPTLLGEGNPPEIFWYKQKKGKLHPLSLISSSVDNNTDRVEEESSVADALLLRIGIHLLIEELPYPQELKRTFTVLARLLFGVEPKKGSDPLTIYTIKSLLRLEKEMSYVLFLYK